VLGKAQDIEKAVYANMGGATPEYKSRIRSLFVNLKDKANPGLRASIVEGSLSPEKFSTMTSQVGFFFPFFFAIFQVLMCVVQEMASEERKAADKKIQEENFFKSLSAAEKQAETDAFQCSRCKQVRGSVL
jgi:transcription elongation factor S-II